MDPSKPNDPRVDYGQPIPRPRKAGDDEVLEGEIIDRGVPIGRPSPSTPPPPPPKKKPAATRRTILWTLLGIAAFICLGGIAATYVFYRKAAEPDRGSPTVTLVQYVEAKFNSRDAIHAADFECSSPHLQAIDQAINAIRALEVKYNIAISVSVSDLQPAVRGATADVSAHLNVAIPESSGVDSVQVQKWSFHFVNDGGWRICGADRLG
ncbi:hypothetical protein [Dactylosporangium darangshiense]|uniref:hypothetical protein n=1 Tax=Dactylosporangium darangshiense TaxID=579108 RepID=UPI0031E83A57